MLTTRRLVLGAGLGTLAIGRDALAQGASGPIRIATAGPMTGQYASFGAQMKAGAEMAVADINAAGGVLGEDVELLEGDAGPDAGATARASVEDQLAKGVDVVIGPPGPGGVDSILDDVTQAGVVLFGPTASGVAPDVADRGLFFRLSPSDRMQGDALADVVAGEGLLAVTAVVQLGGSAPAVAGDLAAGLERSGAAVAQTIPFDPADPAAGPTIEAVRNAAGGGVVFLGDEAPLAQLMGALVDAGTSPERQRWFTTNLTPRLGDPG